MRIGLDISLLCFDQPTGVGNYADGIVDALVYHYPQDQFELCAIVPRRSVSHIMKKTWAAAKNVRLHILPLPQRLFRKFAPIYQYFNSLPIESLFGIECDVFHHFDWYVYPTRAPLTTTLYDLTSIKEPQWHTKEQVRLFTEWFQLIEARTKHYFPISKFIQCDLNKPNTTVVYPAPIRYKNDVDNNDWQQIEKEFNLDQPFFLSVGTIEPRKNYSAIIKAFDSLGQKGIKLVIVGHAGWDAESLKLIKSTSYVTYLSYIKPQLLPYLYKNALALVYPSLSEGFGLPVVETMSVGGIVITSEFTSLPEAGGPAAFYCNPYRIDSVKNAMEKVLLLTPKQRDAIITRGIRHTNQFSYTASAAAMHQVWGQLCG